MSSRAVIFLNGDKSDFSAIRKYIDKDTLLIGCDGGTEKILEMGLQPDIIIGDFDSWDKTSSAEVKIAEHPTDKDYTDSEAAIKYALDMGAKDIILAGFLGSRIDHSLGNIFLLNKSEFSKARIRIIEGSQEVYLISGKKIIKGKKGQTISFMPIFGDVKAISSSGLKYDLAEYDLSLKGNTGISNEMIENRVEVNLGKNKLLVIHEISE